MDGEFGIFKAREKCRKLGSTVFLPKTIDDLKAVGKHKGIEGYDPGEDNFWLPLKVEDLNKRSFPPNVVLPNRRPAPGVFNTKSSISIGAEMTSMWTKRAKKALLTGQARQRRMAFLFYKRGRISLDIFRKPHGVICKQNKLKNSIPDDKRKECWQPESTEYDAIKYTGKDITNQIRLESRMVTIFNVKSVTIISYRSTISQTCHQDKLSPTLVISHQHESPTLVTNISHQH